MQTPKGSFTDTCLEDVNEPPNHRDSSKVNTSGKETTKNVDPLFLKSEVKHFRQRGN